MSTPTHTQSPLNIDEHSFDCPICLDLLCEPVALQCGHTYCQHCITQFIASQTTPSKAYSYSYLATRSYRCPSCKAVIPNACNGFVVCYALREFLKAQFVEIYPQRLHETQHDRTRWNAALLALKQRKARQEQAMNRCFGLPRLQRWLSYQWRALFNPHLHRSLVSFFIGWLLVYLALLCILLPILMPLMVRFRLRTWQDVSSLLGLADLSFSVPSFVSVGHSFLQFFGLLVPSHGTAVSATYSPHHYVPQSQSQSQLTLPYNTIGDIYTAQTTDWYYKPVFEHWTSKELKTFARKHDIPNTCLERSCYTDAIMQYLKDAEWQSLTQSDPMATDILKQYLTHYGVGFAECRNSVWSLQNDYLCFAKKAASVKLVNDVYYNKEYLLSSNAADAHRRTLRQKSTDQSHQTKRQKLNAKRGRQQGTRKSRVHRQDQKRQDRQQSQPRHRDRRHFNHMDMDIDGLPFNLFS